MKVPINISNSIRSFRPTKMRQNPNPREIRWDNDKVLSFDSLFSDRLKSITSSIIEAPPSRDRLRQLIEIINIQMNRSLFQISSNSDEKRDPYGIHLNRMKFYGTVEPRELLAPKNQQASWENSGDQSRADIERIIAHASKRYGVDSDLTRAVVKVESDFDVNCTSSKGAMGLMQLMPETAKELGVHNPYDPIENVLAGTRYLKNLLDRYDGDISLTLAAYNWGMGNVERNPGKLPRETINYIARVNKYYHNTKS